MEILDDLNSIGKYLDSKNRQISFDHMDIPTVQQIVFHTSNEPLLVIFDIRNVRGISATNIFYLSNPDIFYKNQNSWKILLAS